MEKQAARFTDALAAVDELTDVELKALLVWYDIYRSCTQSTASPKEVSFRDWLDSVSEAGDVG